MADDYDIGAAFAAIEEELIASMIRNLKRHRAEEDELGYNWSMWQVEQLKALESYKAANLKKYKGKFKSINSQIDRMLREAKAQGGTDQEQMILNAIKKGFKGFSHASGDALTAQFFRLNERKLEALIKATVDDMQKAEIAILRRANDQYRKIIYNAQVYANSGAGTYEQAVDMATKDFLAAGIACVEYANGARHTLEDYADMAIKTASTRAYLQGEGEIRKGWGVVTVIINKRGDACPKCLPFCGKVMIDDVWSGGPKSGISPVTGVKYPLISDAIAKGLYHPRCRDIHTTYFEGVNTPPDGSRYTKEELRRLYDENRAAARQQYAKRQEKKYDRMARYSLDPENKRRYEARRREWKDQAYRPVTRGESSTIFIQQENGIDVKRVETYAEEIYVSDKAEIKPRVLHMINQRTDQALKEWKVPLKRKPKIVIVSPDEMPTAYGKYDAIQNTVFYIPQIADDKVIENLGDIEFHEMWHMKQAENFRKRYGEITEENYGKYLVYACKEAKKAIDRAGITEYNVGNISRYARDKYMEERFDEVEAEYMTANRKER